MSHSEILYLFFFQKQNNLEEDHRIIKAMAAHGLNQEDIALTIFNLETNKPISAVSLRKCFRRELDTEATLATLEVAKNLYRIATSDNKGAVTAAIFWLTSRAGWKETTAIEVGGVEDKPIPFDALYGKPFKPNRKGTN